jgi:pimeloyl-ACP methyl ester carboxylesterase
MRKLFESTPVSLDGVIESPNRWPTFDDEAAQVSMQELDKYDAFVLPRVAHEFFRANIVPQGAVVAGNSVGGCGAARLAIRRPALVNGPMLIDGGGFRGAPPEIDIEEPSVPPRGNQRSA